MSLPTKRLTPRVALVLVLIAGLLGLSSTTADASDKELQYTFEFVNGITLSGVADDKTYFLADAGGTSVENPTGMEVHLSCSDDFPGGFGEKDGPVRGVDTAWQILSYSIREVDLKKNEVKKECGASFAPPTPQTPPSIDIEKFVNGQDADDATGPELDVGSTATFTYVVTNTGDVELNAVSVVDDVAGAIFCPFSTLGGGESMECESTTMVVEEGQQFMKATVTAQADGTPPAPPVADGKGRGYTFEFVNGVTLSGTADDKTFFLADAGGTSVENPTGMEVHLSCSDDFSGGFGEKDGPVRGVDTAWQILSYSIVEYKDGEIKKSCDDRFGPSAPVELMDMDGVFYFGVPNNPAIDIEKTVNGQDADQAPGPSFEIGDLIVIEYVVTNTGDVTLDNVRVLDDTVGERVCDTDQLAPGESTSCATFEKTATDPGPVFMEATVTGEGNGQVVTDTDPVNFVVEPGAPAIDIEKTVNGQDADQAPGPSFAIGDLIVIEYVVTNTGDVTLDNVRVLDDTVGLRVCDTNQLAPGESTSCATFEKVATQPGPVFMEATVTARGNGQIVLDTDPVNFVIDPANPAIDLEKTINGQDADDAPGPNIPLGDVFVIEYIVTNTGDVPLSDIRVIDAMIGERVCETDQLDPGESTTCEIYEKEASHIGPMFMEATATGVGNGDVVSDTDPINFVVVAAPHPDVEIKKYANGHDLNTEPPSRSFGLGQHVEFTYVVTNTGNTDLTYIQVLDLDLGFRDCPFTTLAPGQSMDCEPITVSLHELGFVAMHSTVTAMSDGGPVYDTDPVFFKVVNRS